MNTSISLRFAIKASVIVRAPVIAVRSAKKGTYIATRVPATTYTKRNITSYALSFLYPVFFWNRKHKDTAPKWRIWFHYAFATVWTCLGVAALIGAIWSLILKLNTDPEVQEAEP